MSDATLVFPRFKYSSGDFSLGLAYIAAYVKREMPNVELTLIDTTFNPSLKYVAKRLEEDSPKVVGIFMDTLMYEDALKIAKLAKSRSAFVIGGGPHATILPDSVLENDCIDAVCIGEGEITFTEVLRECLGGKELGKVHGIWYKEDGRVVRNPAREPMKDIDQLPFPDMEFFDLETYIDNFIQFDSYRPGIRGMSTIVSRGCPFRCTYCQPTLEKVFGKKFRIRSPQSVFEELKLLKAKYNVEAVYFQDDTLTVSKKWIAEFCNIMVESDLNLVWACNTRADIIDEQMLRQMKEAGLVKIKVGIESMCDRIRNDVYRKNVSSEQIRNVIDAATGMGIHVTGFFMLGAPTESLADVKETIRFATHSRLDEANFSITVPLPGTHLYETAKEHNWKVPDRLCDYDYYHAARAPMADGDISNKKLERYKQWAYICFYFHPKRWWSSFRTALGIKGMRKALQKLKRF